MSAQPTIFLNAWHAMAVATAHADSTKNTSASLCIEDARQHMANGNPEKAIGRIRASLAHSVGIFHPDYMGIDVACGSVSKATAQ